MRSVLDVLADLANVEHSRSSQSPRESPPPFGLGQTVRVGVQPSPPAREPTTSVDDHPSGHRDHAQQLTDQGPPLATDTSPHRGFSVGLALGYPPRASNHSRVYRFDLHSAEPVAAAGRDGPAWS
jgi:hypothetical protein